MIGLNLELKKIIKKIPRPSIEWSHKIEKKSRIGFCWSFSPELELIISMRVKTPNSAQKILVNFIDTCE